MYHYVGVQPVVTCSQLRHYHVLWPSKKVVDILFVTWPQITFDNGGLFLVAQQVMWHVVALSMYLPLRACLLVRFASPGTPQWADIYWMPTLQLLLSSCTSSFCNSLLVRACSTVRSTAMEVFCFVSVTRELAFINASESAL